MTYETCFEIERSLARIEETLEDDGAGRGHKLLECVQAALSAATVDRIRLELQADAEDKFTDAFQGSSRVIAR